jgi:tRNA threonylcarbamoyladenosine biosynthesis protein TsaE
MRKIFITKNSKETQKLGKMLAEELKSGSIIALQGALGSGKTTFTQGFLAGLKVKGPYTSPTFVVLKHYKIKNQKSKIKNSSKNSKVLKFKIINIYHADAYRVNSKDILSLGWEEIISNPENIVIIEWADRIRKIIPAQAIWIKFEWVSEKERKVTFGK